MRYPCDSRIARLAPSPPGEGWGEGLRMTVGPPLCEGTMKRYSFASSAAQMLRIVSSCPNPSGVAGLGVLA